MANNGTDQLEEVQHPTLGPLKFPVSMGHEDRNAAIDHLEKMHSPATEKDAAQTPMEAPPPPQKMNKVGLITGMETTPEEEEQIQNRAAKVKNNMITPVTNAATIMIPAAGAADAAEAGQLGRYALHAGRGLTKVAVGQEAAGAIGKKYGGDTGETIGKVVGGAAGMFTPDRSLARIPGMSALFGADELADFKAADKLSQNNADIRAGVKQHPGVPAHAEMEEEIANAQKERAGAKSSMDKDIERGRGTRVKAYDEMNRDITQEQGTRAAAKNEMDQEISEGHQFRVGANNEMEQDIQKGRQERAGGRDVAHNDLAEARMRRGREQEKIDAGTATEGSSQKVIRIPEPNPVPPGENPNNQQSVPRRTTLVQNAKRGKEGAGLQLNQIHGPTLYEPRGSGYGGPRTWDPNAPPEAPEAGPTVGNGKPIVPSKSGPNKVITDAETQPVNPQEIADVQARYPGRQVTPDNVNDILRDEAQNADVSEKLKGNRVDRTGNIREAHRSSLEKPGRGTSQINLETDNNGIRWAVDKDGVRISIPKRITDPAEVQAYAKEKLAEQIELRKNIP